MPRRIVVLLLLHLLQLLPLLQTLHLLHPVLTLRTGVTTVAKEAIPLRSALPDAVIFKLRLTKSTPPYLPISRTSNALLVARMKVITFHHQRPGLLLFLPLNGCSSTSDSRARPSARLLLLLETHPPLSCEYGSPLQPWTWTPHTLHHFIGDSDMISFYLPG